MSALRTYKKGELIFREGDKISSLFLLQSGGISLCLTRPKKTIDLLQVGSGSVLGESVLAGFNQFAFSGLATTESKIFEIPIDALTAQIDASPQILRVLIKSLAERLRSTVSEVKNSRLERDGSPLPEDQVAKAFGAIFHTLHLKGEVDPKTQILEMQWAPLKAHTQRIFSETARRIEQCLMLLKKLGLAELTYGKPDDDPEGADELKLIRTKDLKSILGFVEFYQYYYFRGGKTELLRVDDSDLWLLESFVQLAIGKPVDRFGSVSIEYGHLVDHIREGLGYQINKDHFHRLEQKGLYVKRVNNDSGVPLVQFELNEFNQRFQTWRILREIQKWNEKGFVDLDDPVGRPKKKAAGTNPCSQCGTEMPPAAKFCSQCGAKSAAA